MAAANLSFHNVEAITVDHILIHPNDVVSFQIEFLQEDGSSVTVSVFTHKDAHLQPLHDLGFEATKALRNRRDQ